MRSRRFGVKVCARCSHQQTITSITMSGTTQCSQPKNRSSTISTVQKKVWLNRMTRWLLHIFSRSLRFSSIPELSLYCY